MAASGADPRGPLHEVVAAVRIDGGEDVEDPLVDELGDLVDPAVVFHQVPDGVQADLAALDLVPVNVGLDVHGGLAHFRAGVRDC